MFMFNDTEWTKKGDTEICLHNAEELAAFATQFKPGHWCSPRHQKCGGTDIPTNPKDNGTLSHCRCFIFSSVTLHIQYFQRQFHYRLVN